MKLLVIDNGNSGNNGVMGMAVALCHNLPPEWELTVSLDNPINEVKDRRRFELDGVQTKPNLLGFLHVYMSKAGIKLLFPFVAFLWFILQTLAPKLVPARYVRFRDYDVVVSLCGEDFFSDNWSLHNCLFRLTHCLCTFLLRKKLVILAQTFGPFKRRWSRTIAKFCIKHSSLVTARDHRSFLELVALVGVNDRIRETRDLAFLLKPTEWGTVVGRHPELTSFPPRFVAVSVSKTFAVNVLRTNELSRIDPERFRKAMAQCLDDFIAATDIPLVFVPQVVVGPSGDDRHEAEKILERMTHRNKIIVLGDEYTAGDLKALISHAQMVVGCRMHAQVAAISQGVPLLALAYSPKSLDVIGKAFNYEYVLDARNMEPFDFTEKAAAMMIKLAAELEATSRFLFEAIPSVIAQSQSNIDLLVASCLPESSWLSGDLRASDE